MPSLQRLRALARQLAAPPPQPSAVAAALDEQPRAASSSQEAPPPILFDDRQMMEFVREGYVMFHLADLPKSYHEGVMQTLDKAFEKGGNPGNNMLPMCPQLTTMLNHPLVRGALQSILGPDYWVHMHRHPHFRDNIDEGEPGKVHHLHKDSMTNSRFAVDAKRRQHRTRMCMLIYFPQVSALSRISHMFARENRRTCNSYWVMQDTPVELGPTAIMPRSHYLLHAPDGGDPLVPYQQIEAVPLAGPAGTLGTRDLAPNPSFVISPAASLWQLISSHSMGTHRRTNHLSSGIIHYDLLHTSTNKSLEQPRHMIKFLFSRMSEPDAGPSWNSEGMEWVGSDDIQEPIWRAQWDWHCGRPDKPSWDDVVGATGDVPALSEQLQSNVESEAVCAAYTLGCGGRGVEATAALMQTLCMLPESDENDKPDELSHKFFESDPISQAGYGLVEQGAAAVPALLEAVASGVPLIRARAIDVLGDMGPQASAAIPALLGAFDDIEMDPRRRAVEAIGTVGCGSVDQAELCATLVGMMRDPHEQVRRNAAYSLQRLGPAIEAGTKLEAEAVEVLSAGLTDSNGYVRGFSSHALERIGTPASLGAVLKHLQVMRFD
jgi:HEAT repeat protein